MREMGDALADFVQKNGFKAVTVLTATVSPVKRERESNRQLPEIFAYANNFLFKQDGDYYEKNGIRKFGYWLGDKKVKAHQELNELAFAGASTKLMKCFNRIDVPCVLYVMFTPGELD